MRAYSYTTTTCLHSKCYKLRSSKTSALIEIGDGGGGGRSLLAGLTDFMVLDFFAATKFSLCHLPFTRCGTVQRATLHVPTSSSSLCSTTLKLLCLHVVTCLVFSTCVSGNVKYCSAAFSDHCHRDFDRSREQVVSPVYGSQHTVKHSLSRSTCTQKNDVCSVTVTHNFIDVPLGNILLLALAVNWRHSEWRLIIALSIKKFVVLL